MRKALFAVVLVSASFAGGAVVNGPGLRWVQAMVFSRIGLDEESGGDGDLSAATDPATATATATGPATASAPRSEAGSPSSAEETVPARPIPPLVLDASGIAKEPRRSLAKGSRPETLSASQLPGLAPVPEGTPPLENLPRVEIPPPALAAATPESSPRAEKTQAPDPTEDRDPAIRRVSLPGAGNSVPLPALIAAPPVAPAPAALNEWAEVRNTLRTLGVSRYGIEGEPAGRVRFHCVIPLAGRRAVGQHFEGEGDDELQAARAALKRVALWRATEGAAPVP